MLTIKNIKTIVESLIKPILQILLLRFPKICNRHSTILILHIVRDRDEKFCLIFKAIKRMKEIRGGKKSRKIPN